MTGNGQEWRNDWTTVTDPKAKKRLQNRVAQRTYRIKMKQRLQQLQETVDRQQKDKTGSGTGTSRPGVADNPTNSIDLNLTEAESSTALTSYDSQYEMRPSLQMTTESWTHVGMEEDLLPQFMNHAARDPMLCPSHASLHRPALLPHQDSPHANSQDASKLSNMRSLSFSQYQLSPMDRNLASRDAFPSPSMLHQRIPDEGTMYDLPELTPDTHPSASSSVSWRAAERSVSRQGSISCSPTDFPEAAKEPLGTASWSNGNKPVSNKPPFILPSKDATLAERFECLMQCTEHLGFDSLDSMIATYYVSDLSPSSVASNEQCLSRNRRLPTVLAELREHSKSWTQWERRGYQDETLKAAEDIFIDECSRFQTDGGLAMGDLNQRETPSQLIPVAIRTFQNRLPNLWALFTALALDRTASRQRHHSYTVFMILLILCCSGQIPISQLLACLAACLESLRSEG